MLRINTLLILFLSISTLLLFVFGAILFSSENKLSNSQTELNLPVIERDKSYDLIILGSSHARIFSRGNNHELSEKLLRKKIINISQGGNKEDVTNQKIYLEYFYQRNNSVKSLVYFLDPFTFYRYNLRTNNSFVDEPFRPDFLLRLYLSSEENTFVVLNYLKNMMKVPNKRLETNYNSSSVSSLDASPSAKLIGKRIRELYLDPYDQIRFDHIKDSLKEIILSAKSHNTKVTIVLPTTLLPLNSVDDLRVLDEIKNLSKLMGFNFVDLRHSISNSSLYYDSDHLNSKGIKFFIESNPNIFN